MLDFFILSSVFTPIFRQQNMSQILISQTLIYRIIASVVGIFQFVVGVVYTNYAFKKKNELFWLINATLSLASIVVICMCIPAQEVAYMTFILCEITYYFLFLTYVKRIKFLGKIKVKLDGAIPYVPFSASVLLLGPVAAYVIAKFDHSFDYVVFYSSFFGWTVLLASETYFFAVLYKKTKIMQRGRLFDNRAIYTQMIVSFILAVTGDFVLLYLRFNDQFLAYILRFIFIQTRVLFVINYFHILGDEHHQGMFFRSISNLEAFNPENE
eukprot:NODE_319_length_11107_cov_0.311228.p4 type:complete len:269 gc:universal NODE_319_length_11107_cov_0.311228:10122-10928(+)